MANRLDRTASCALGVRREGRRPEEKAGARHAQPCHSSSLTLEKLLLTRLARTPHKTWRADYMVLTYRCTSGMNIAARSRAARFPAQQANFDGSAVRRRFGANSLFDVTLGVVCVFPSCTAVKHSCGDAPRKTNALPARCARLFARACRAAKRSAVLLPWRENVSVPAAARFRASLPHH